jgi:hypothetical protein
LAAAKIDPTMNVAAGAVLRAFESARRSGRPSVECYRAGVGAGIRIKPPNPPQSMRSLCSSRYTRRSGSSNSVLLDTAAVLPLHRGMNQPLKPGARHNTERAAREERLAKALRDNLRRRKEQARAQQRRAAPLSQKGDGGGSEPLA